MANRKDVAITNMIRIAMSMGSIAISLLPPAMDISLLYIPIKAYRPKKKIQSNVKTSTAIDSVHCSKVVS
jgi:hypothetical protein